MLEALSAVGQTGPWKVAECMGMRSIPFAIDALVVAGEFLKRPEDGLFFLAVNIYLASVPDVDILCDTAAEGVTKSRLRMMTVQYTGWARQCRHKCDPFETLGYQHICIIGAAIFRGKVNRLLKE